MRRKESPGNGAHHEYGPGGVLGVPDGDGVREVAGDLDALLTGVGLVWAELDVRVDLPREGRGDHRTYD
jgi:hypothetical protein